jgi:hypothetical protein
MSEAAANCPFALSVGRRCSISAANWRPASACDVPDRRAASTSSAIWLSTTMSVGASRRCVPELIWKTSRRSAAMVSLMADRRATAFSSATMLSVSDETKGLISRSSGPCVPSASRSRSLSLRRVTSAASCTLTSSRRCRSVAASSAGAAAIMRSAEADSSRAARVKGTRASPRSSWEPTCLMA